VLHYSALKILIFPSFYLRWETTRTAPSRMTVCARVVCIITASLCCCGMPLCMLAMGTEPHSTTVGSMRSTTYNVARFTSIFHPILCFLMRWAMSFRFTTHRTARPSHCTVSRTALTQSGRLAWMRGAMSFRFTTAVAVCTWLDMPRTYFSYSTTRSASLRSSGASLLDMLRKSRTSPRRSVARPRRLVLCVSRSGTWRVAFATKLRHF
jgi:hypothetical protein